MFEKLTSYDLEKKARQKSVSIFCIGTLLPLKSNLSCFTDC